MKEKALEVTDKQICINYKELSKSEFDTSLDKLNIKNNIKNIVRATIELSPTVIETIAPEEIYKIKYIPKGSKILVDKEGDLIGVCSKNGKISGPVRLEKIGRQYTQLAKGLGQQILLVHIANELNEIKKEIRSIESGLHDDRVATIQSGIKSYKCANSKDLILQCITPLRTGICKLSKELHDKMNNMPELKATFCDNWFGKSKTEELSRFNNNLVESFSWICEGYKTLILCYLELENYKGSQNVMCDFQQFSDDLDYQRLINLSRHLPISSSCEEHWRKLKVKEKRIEYFNNLKEISSRKYQQKEFCIRISGEELKELQNELL